MDFLQPLVSFTFWGKKETRLLGVVKTLGCKSYNIALGWFVFFFNRLCCFFFFLTKRRGLSHFSRGRFLESAARWFYFIPDFKIRWGLLFTGRAAGTGTGTGDLSRSPPGFPLQGGQTPASGPRPH